jgi:hypothetical protein
VLINEVTLFTNIYIYTHTYIHEGGERAIALGADDK